jgi:hypothetical protein
MFRSALFLALSATLFAPALSAQTPVPDQPQATVPACLAAATLDQLPKALDDAISGPGDRDRTCLRQLMLPDVRLVLMARGADGGVTPRTLSLDDWISAMQRRGPTPLFERQVKVRTETYGGIAHLWNTYEIRPAADAKATSRGINSIQAIFDGQRWRVVEVLWEAEAATEPIPERYLP